VPRALSLTVSSNSDQVCYEQRNPRNALCENAVSHSLEPCYHCVGGSPCQSAVLVGSYLSSFGETGPESAGTGPHPSEMRAEFARPCLWLC
jgi:hypothetical protein